MKKIMFSDKYGLTQAVLERRKTMTRMIITCPKEFKGEWVAGFYVYKRQSDNAIIQYPCMYDADECTFDGGEILPKYKVGEVVAIAQRYKDAGYSEKEVFAGWPFSRAGWNNKLFVAAGKMPHHIRITDIKVERLQDISDEDCIKEGIETMKSYAIRADWTKKTLDYYRFAYRCKNGRYLHILGCTAREVYSALIDRIYSKGTWENNPWVFAYEFELVD